MDTEYFDFKDHMDSVEWINSLPRGMIHQRMNTLVHTVTITKNHTGWEVYVGPKDMDGGGEGIAITLDDDLALVSYEIERIAPSPY
ncbi:MAG: hypothetical protein ABJ000_12510 [Saccharospirillum sp.]|uniref:hypothetical protein n=1 Tax=Saccharospirillum sp. TaxID=2033801 RepID=UPI003299D4D0